MKSTKILLIGSLFLVSLSCETKNEQIDVKSKTEIHEHDEIEQEIELNNGEKWEVIPAMMKIIQEMEISVINFKGNNLTDYQDLAKILQVKINELTSSCTMEGKAHDELHKWLVPFIESVEEFSEIKTDAEGKEFIINFINDFKQFNTYFI